MRVLNRRMYIALVVATSRMASGKTWFICTSHDKGSVCVSYCQIDQWTPMALTGQVVERPGDAGGRSSEG